MKEISVEELRAIHEGLDEETLAIFDLIKKPTLSKKEEEEVRKVAVKTLQILKEEKLKIERWRESSQVAAQVRTVIFDIMQWLPQESYVDDEVRQRSDQVYQHIYANYPGGDCDAYV